MIEEKEKLSDEKLEDIVGGTQMSPVEADFTSKGFDTPLGMNREKMRLSDEETAATQTDFAVKFDKKIDSLR